jgi:hypothetical protein
VFLSSVSIRTTTHVFEHTIPSRDSFRIPKTSVVTLLQPLITASQCLERLDELFNPCR